MKSETESKYYQVNLQNMLDIAHEANKLYDGLFMPLIKSKNE